MGLLYILQYVDAVEGLRADCQALTWDSSVLLDYVTILTLLKNSLFVC